MSYVKCSGAIEECLQCTHSDCIHDTRLNKATRDGKLVKVDDFVKGDRIFERSMRRGRKRKMPCSAATETGQQG